MLKPEFIEMMRNDKELQELKRRVIELTGSREPTVFRIGANYTYEDWKEQLRRIIKDHEK
ncbi:hypothetical protein B5E84_18295 [Lachnoclostridium sp. An14]|nr:hypothetical protein B5E84_18295 [Lachnoclostridium sp. An14]